MNTLATLLVLFLAFVHESVGYSYSISNAAQFMEFASDVNNGMTYSGDTVYLTDDIDLSAYSKNYAPVGLGFGVWFLGTFDGQGHTFSNLKFNNTKYDNVGIFGDIGGGVIKNFVVDDSCSFTVLYDPSRIGCIVTNIGGIAGSVFTFVGEAVLTNLVNMASINGGYDVGGIVGSGLAHKTEGTITITNSVNYGSIIGMRCDSELGSVGGIVGYLGTDGPAYTKFTISNCANYGYVSKPHIIRGSSRLSGIIGDASGPSLINNNVNIGTMEADGEYTYGTGNVAGYVVGRETGPTIFRNDYWIAGNLVNKSVGTIEYIDGDNVTILQSVDFNNEYLLSKKVEVGTYSGRSLIDALNAENPENPKWSLVSFVMNGGKFPGHSLSTIPAFDGHFPAPVKEGATFKGWYLDSDFTKKYVPSSGYLLEKLILYAKW